MELREYVKIFQEQIWVFFGTVAIFVFAGISTHLILPDDYRSYLNLNVTRAGGYGSLAHVNAYEYDEFYRLQADERFADTVVRWIGSMRFQHDVLRESGAKNNLQLKAKRLSSQMIEVSYVTTQADQSKKVSKVIVDEINKKSKELNKDQKIRSWFKVVDDEPFVEKNKIEFWKMISICVSLGLFLGVWMVFIFHYFKKQK